MGSQNPQMREMKNGGQFWLFGSCPNAICQIGGRISGGGLGGGTAWQNTNPRFVAMTTYTLHYWPILARNMCAVLVAKEAGLSRAFRKPLRGTSLRSHHLPHPCPQ